MRTCFLVCMMAACLFGVTSLPVLAQEGEASGSDVANPHPSAEEYRRYDLAKLVNILGVGGTKAFLMALGVPEERIKIANSDDVMRLLSGDSRGALWDPLLEVRSMGDYELATLVSYLGKERAGMLFVASGIPPNEVKRIEIFHQDTVSMVINPPRLSDLFSYEEAERVCRMHNVEMVVRAVGVEGTKQLMLAAGVPEKSIDMSRIEIFAMESRPSVAHSSRIEEIQRYEVAALADFIGENAIANFLRDVGVPEKHIDAEKIEAFTERSRKLLIVPPLALRFYDRYTTTIAERWTGPAAEGLITISDARTTGETSALQRGGSRDAIVHGLRDKVLSSLRAIVQWVRLARTGGAPGTAMVRDGSSKQGASGKGILDHLSEVEKNAEARGQNAGKRTARR